jgi:hypothetical protein
LFDDVLNIQADWLEVPANGISMDSRIAAVIAIVEDIPELYQVATAYRMYPF